MSIADFIHLHTHSAYSLSTGSIRVKELTALCKLHRMPAVAMTDSGNLFGALEFAMAARDDGVQPIIGCELAIRRADHEARGRLGKPALPEPVALLVQDEVGYHNLLALVSASFLEGDGAETPQVDLEKLAKHSDGLILLTGDASWAGRAVAERRDRAMPPRRCWRSSPKCSPTGSMSNSCATAWLTKTASRVPLIDLAYAQNLPLVATNNVYFDEEEFYEAHDVLLCIADGTTVSNGARRKLTRQHYFKSPSEMRMLFADLPEACDNTLVIAQRCAYMPEPRAPILPPFPTVSRRRKTGVARRSGGGSRAAG